MRREKCFNPLVSIVVPVYNTQPYLRKCLDSILNQTYKNVEVICVDDGSTDGSELIVDDYAKKDYRVRVIHKGNGGESSARNAGLKIMTGNYVGFVDCDDWIESDMYEKLVNTVIKKNVDMVASSWFCDRENSSEKIVNRLSVTDNVFDREYLLTCLYKRDDYRGFAYMWNKLYKRELFYDIYGRLMLFDEDLSLGGDVLYLAKLALNSKRAVYMDKGFYHYIQRERSGCHTQDLSKLKDWLEAYRRVIIYIQSMDIETNVMPWIKRFMAYHSSNIAEIAYKQKNKEVLGHCQKVMKQYEREYISTNQHYPDRIERYYKILKYKLSGGFVDEVAKTRA